MYTKIRLYLSLLKHTRHTENARYTIHYHIYHLMRTSNTENTFSQKCVCRKNVEHLSLLKHTKRSDSFGSIYHFVCISNTFSQECVGVCV